MTGREAIGLGDLLTHELRDLEWGRRGQALDRDIAARRAAAMASAADAFARDCERYGEAATRAAFKAAAKGPRHRPASDETKRDDRHFLDWHEANLKAGLTVRRSAEFIGMGRTVEATMRKLQRLAKAKIPAT